ncbi:receptor-like protein kinase 5 [Diospyros lotus]|uniref:receptor-like protein kinase 5 n=1 Tax=Diospyros lotus TaxID=55363 RepID=UPI00225641F6|nr:receptor-like protein kinase 5 [Diospyros lotus]
MALHLLFLLLSLAFHANAQPPAAGSEQSILLELKQFWSNPPSLNHWSSSPNSTAAHCDWPEITCTAGSVTGLALGHKSITGPFPPFICDLRNLVAIDLQDNNILGKFPTALYSCSSLEILDLSQNYFVGEIPSDVDRLSPLLRSFNVGGNNFTTIPPAIGRFPELRILQLFQDEFNGSFPPEIGNLSNLEYLEMSFNHFEPMAVPSSFTQLKKLKQLRIRDARLIGKIPETIWNLTALEILDLSINGLTGTIPSGVFQLKNLSTIYLFRNQLSGEIPRSIQCPNLKIIDFSQNNLTGTIPQGFGKLTKLTELGLFMNQFSGEVPERIGRIQSLTLFKLFDNNFSGVLPPELGRYSKLNLFHVSSNQFSGQLPEFLCANGALTTAFAFGNTLSGELPKSLGDCRTLLSLRVHGNRLSGSIPPGLWTSPSLTTLTLQENSFSGHLPDKLGSNLSRLEISNNRFSGEIPAGISSWYNLTFFNASNNLFTGLIPQGLTALSNLNTLLLDGNQLSGRLPTDMVSWKSLNALNLGGNHLSGPIPAEIGSLPTLTGLDLSRNQFFGQIPPEIGNLRLNSLNLSSNHLTGRIPVEFENAIFDKSFLNNPGLCASNPSFGLQVCSLGSQNSSKISTLLLVVIVSIAVLVFVLATISVIFGVRRSIRRKREPGLDSTWKFTQFQTLNFKESDILPGLTEANVIGSGRFGKVFRVELNGSGKDVAVKRMMNARKLEKEFLAEVKILSTIRHSNIVKLQCCISNETTKLLVYEFLECHSLDRWLHRKKWQSRMSGPVQRITLDWPKRFQIAVGTARGLSYMHHDCSPPVIHRDLKSSNILLDAEFNPKIADFGLAKLLFKHGEPNTISVVAGSVGYLAPEYARTVRVTEKVDVYSYGVVLLELVTGREAKNDDEDACLAEWAWHHIQKGNPIADALDEEVKKPCYLEEMTNVFKLGIMCTNMFPTRRPSMREVLHILIDCSHQRETFGDKNGGRERDVSPLLKNSRHERVLDEDDGDLVSSV